MAPGSLQFKVKLDPGCSRNVKSNVESDVDLSCSAVIFQQGLNLLLTPRSRSACAQENATVPPPWRRRKKKSLAHNKFHKWQNSFLSLSFPLSSLLLSLPHPSHFQRRRAKGGAGGGRSTCEPIMNFDWLSTFRCLAPSLRGGGEVVRPRLRRNSLPGDADVISCYKPILVEV